MSGPLAAIVAGLGYGIFQTLNRRAVQGMDVFLATLMQLAISALVLIVIALFTLDLSLLSQAPTAALVNFSLAGLIHFFIGWTFLNTSQKRIGAARTSALIGTGPLFAAVFALLTLGEVPTWAAAAGIALIVGGVVVTNRSPAAGNGGRPRWQEWALGLGAPVCWSISPIFVRFGLQDMPSPLLGVTVGLTASALGYGVAFAIHTLRSGPAHFSMDAMTFKVIAAVLVGLSTWLRWIALDLTDVAVVLALSLTSVPTVNLLTPLVVDRKIERVTRNIWIGSMLIVAGSLVLILL